MKHSSDPKRARLLIALAAVLCVSLLAWSVPRTRAGSQASAYLPAILRLDESAQIPDLTATALASSTTLPTRTAPETPTPTQTTTPTPTSTATPTPTATQELPQNCPNTYPIAVDAQLLDHDHFLPPQDPNEQAYYGIYNDEIYSNKSQRRVYQAQLNLPGFGFARWRASTPPDSATALAASLSGTGNISQGFDEAPWPTGTWLGPKQSSYPLRPHQLGPNDGDWIYGSGASISSDIIATFQYHIDHRTLMTLPIVDGIAGQGSNKSYHVSRLGHFLLRGYGTQAGKGWYLDLVYIDLADTSVCM
jgi:hypothetical protein